MNAYYVERLKDETNCYYCICKSEDLSIVPTPTRYLVHKTKSNRSPNTVKRIAFSLSYYLTYLDTEHVCTNDVVKLSYENQHKHFTDFLNWLKEGNHTKGRKINPNNFSSNTYLRDVFGWYQFQAMEEQLNNLKVFYYREITFSNSVGIKKKKNCWGFKGFLPEDEHIGRTIEAEKINALFLQCSNIRDKLLLLLFAESGFRIGEMLGVHYTSDIDYERHKIRVCFRKNRNGARAKNAEYRWAKISEETFSFLLSYLAEYRNLLVRGEYLFINLTGEKMGEPMNVNSVYAVLRRLEKKTGIKATPHMLRHYFANQRHKNGWDMTLISQALGHRSIVTTEKYLNIDSDELLEASENYFLKNKNLLMADHLLEM